MTKPVEIVTIKPAETAVEIDLNFGKSFTTKKLNFVSTDFINKKEALEHGALFSSNNPDIEIIEEKPIENKLNFENSNDDSYNIKNIDKDSNIQTDTQNNDKTDKNDKSNTTIEINKTILPNSTETSVYETCQDVVQFLDYKRKKVRSNTIFNTNLVSKKFQEFEKQKITSSEDDKNKISTLTRKSIKSSFSPDKVNSKDKSTGLFGKDKKLKTPSFKSRYN